jgi:hypothetical protein
MYFLRFIAALFLAIPISGFSATVTHAAKGADVDYDLRIWFDGTILRSDVSAIETVLNRYPKREVTVNISSLGGDVEAALDIGRLIRSRKASITIVDTCYSSCVFIYAGAVQRMNSARLSSGHFETNRPNGATGLGIHRFYFAALPEDASTSKVTAARNSLREKIERYLHDMNISNQLLDAMESIPPERMKLLSLREANSLGLSDTDPVHDEQQVAWYAARYKITSAEYRRRSVAAETYCLEQDRKKVCRNDGVNCDFGYIWDCRMKFIQAGTK